MRVDSMFICSRHHVVWRLDLTHSDKDKHTTPFASARDIKCRFKLLLHTWKSLLAIQESVDSVQSEYRWQSTDNCTLGLIVLFRPDEHAMSTGQK